MKPEYKFTIDSKITSCKDCPLVRYEETSEHTRIGHISHEFISCRLTDMPINLVTYRRVDIDKNCKLKLVEHRNY
jgi:hypothetical protein